MWTMYIRWSGLKGVISSATESAKVQVGTFSNRLTRDKKLPPRPHLVDVSVLHEVQAAVVVVPEAAG